METSRSSPRYYWGLLVLAIVATAAVTYSAVGLAGSQSSTTNSQQMQRLVGLVQSENSILQSQTGTGQASANYSSSINPVEIYAETSGSVVTVQGVQVSASGNSTVLGSGFVLALQNSFYVVTNFHVVQNAVGVTVTFANGDAYPAKVVGTDPYSDLAVLNSTAPARELHPLKIVGSASLVVGQPVVAIGNPFGLSGSMTVGIISQLGRTISESLAGNFAIADVIQFSAPINPGNSGGALLDANGNVIGITTATIGSSQGVGFAIPSDTIIRELPLLVGVGGYSLHSYMGIQSVDMNYPLAQLEGTNVTYGVLVETVASGGPADDAGLRGGSSTATVQGSQYTIGGDIIVSINGTKIANTDALSAFLEERTLPSQTIVLGIIRGGHVTTLDLVLGTRPPPPSS